MMLSEKRIASLVGEQPQDVQDAAQRARSEPKEIKQALKERPQRLKQEYEQSLADQKSREEEISQATTQFFNLLDVDSSLRKKEYVCKSYVYREEYTPTFELMPCDEFLARDDKETFALRSLEFHYKHHYWWREGVKAEFTDG